MAENALDAVWLDANRYYDAEAQFYVLSRGELQRKANPGSTIDSSQTEGLFPIPLSSQIASARERIENILKSGDAKIDSSRHENIQKQNEKILQQIAKLTADMNDVLNRVSSIEKFIKTLSNESPASVKIETKTTIQNGSPQAPADDDDLDLFGSDEEEDAEAAKLKEERLKAYANKKAKKPALVAKSSVVLDVKPWDDETDMKELEKAVRAVETEGLVWGASKLVPLAYGINKLQIVAVVEDEKVSIDWLQETISENDELVQSVDIAAFNKL